jgi:heme/copper-type cytochrome/quinol oxidase subunit 2
MRPRPTLVVDVVAFRWNWRFDYPDSGVRVVGVKGRPAELVVPDDSASSRTRPSCRSPSGWA